MRTKNDWWGDPFYVKCWVKLTALERNRRLSIIFARSASAVTHTKNVQLILIGSHYALSNEPKMNIVRCLYASKWGGGGQKRKVSKI